MPEQAQAKCKQTIRVKARAMDMNDDKTGKKTRSIAAAQRRAKGESPIPMQSAGPGGAPGPQAPGRAGAPPRPAVAKASGAVKKETGHAKPDGRSAASTTTNPKTGEATMDPKEEGRLEEAVKRIGEEGKAGIARLEKRFDRVDQRIDNLDDKFSSRFYWLTGVLLAFALAIIVVLFGKL